MATLGDSGSSSTSSGPHETLTIVYAETYAPSPSLEGSSSTTSYSSQTTISQDSEESLTVFAEIEVMKDMEKTLGYLPVSRSMSTTQGPKMKALDYFQMHRTFQLFTFMMSHLLAHSPEEPIAFLVSLVDRCIQYRDHGKDPPLLFEDSHVRSVYTALDPVNDGSIDYQQYVNGMVTLGVTEFESNPEGMVKKNKNVPKDVFIREANRALLNQLDVLVDKRVKDPEDF